MPKNLLDNIGGLKTYHAFEDGKNYISYEQDNVAPLMDWAHAVREEGDTAKASPDGYCAARLPDSVVLELKFKHGLDILRKMTPTDERRFWYLLETEYRAFKLTNKKMWRR